MHIATKILNSYNFLSRCIRMIRSLAAQSISSHIHQRGVQQKRHLLLSISMFCTQPKVLVYTSPIPKKQWIIFPLLSEHFFGIFSGRDHNSPRELIVVASNVAVIQTEHCELEAVVTLVSVTLTGQNARSHYNNTHIVFLSILPEGETVRPYSSSNNEPAHWEAL